MCCTEGNEIKIYKRFPFSGVAQNKSCVLTD